MEPKKELTKKLLASSLKEIMLHQPFEKITIRMITEHAGVIRPTFYYHFQDKFEVLEWIVRYELIGGMRILFDRGLIDEALRMAFACIDDDREFYTRAFTVTGQNGFMDIMYEQIRQFLLEFISTLHLRTDTGVRALSRETLASHYSMVFVNTVRIWLDDNRKDVTSVEMAELFLYFMHNTFSDSFTSEGE